MCLWWQINDELSTENPDHSKHPNWAMCTPVCQNTHTTATQAAHRGRVDRKTALRLQSNHHSISLLLTIWYFIVQLLSSQLDDPSPSSATRILIVPLFVFGAPITGQSPESEYMLFSICADAFFGDERTIFHTIISPLCIIFILYHIVTNWVFTWVNIGQIVKVPLSFRQSPVAMCTCVSFKQSTTHYAFHH